MYKNKILSMVHEIKKESTRKGYSRESAGGGM